MIINNSLHRIITNERKPQKDKIKTKKRNEFPNRARTKIIKNIAGKTRKKSVNRFITLSIIPPLSVEITPKKIPATEAKKTERNDIVSESLSPHRILENKSRPSSSVPKKKVTFCSVA